MKKRSLIILALLLALSLWAAPLLTSATQAAEEPPPAEPVDPALESAFQARILENQTNVLAFLLNDIRIQAVKYSSDGRVALLLLAMFDPESGEIIVGEPGLAVAQLDDSDPLDPQWKITLQVDEDFLEVLEIVPEEILPPETREQYFIDREEQKNFIQSTVFRGYKLPWAAGTSRRLSQSVQHINTTCPGTLSCLYAFDFADSYTQANWPILASKGGIVTRVKWDTPDRAWNDVSTPPPGTGNYIVIEDRSTSPTTYQLYLHLSYDTIPQRLRTPGAIVNQGEFIGNVDNTGQSWGSHLHFHVHTNPSSYWGSSVDIRFDDVAINDGRPRTCWEASNMSQYGSQCNTGNWFTSGNVGANPPAGDLILPGDGDVIERPILQVGGYAWDDQQVTSIQIIARGIDGVWRDVGEAFNESPFMKEINLCTAGLPNGPVDIALRVWDNHGNVTVLPQGMRTVLKNYACTQAPACTLTSNKVILYSEPNYQGACREFLWNGEITIPNLGTGALPVGGNTQSVRVGSNVRAVFYTGANYTDRAEAFERDDPNLADNPIGAKSAASLRVQARSFTSLESAILLPAAGASIPSTETVSLFMNSPFATGFRYTLNKDGSLYAVYDNLSFPGLVIGSLPPGSYSLRGCALVSATGSSCADQTGWQNFTVTAASLSNNSQKTVPYSTVFAANEDWHASGLWTYTGSSWRYGNGTSYAGSGPNYGSLTSPPIAIPASGTAYLRFDYKYKTETTSTIWDQRRIQVSVDGGPFSDLPQWPQMWNDPPDDSLAQWLNSPAIDLSAYRGRTIRIRFYFSTFDHLWNQGMGWEIGRFEINTTAPDLSCANVPANNSINAATPMNVPQTVTGSSICPGGDMDYYTFYGFTGQRIVARVDAMSLGSSLDPYLFLLDQRGTLMVENDDIEPGVIRDSQIGTVLPYSGQYFLRVKAWDHPRAGGSNYFYNLRIFEDSNPPRVNLTFPAANWISDKPFKIQAEVNDNGSGVDQVDFYFRPQNSVNVPWIKLGSDLTRSDGWSLEIDPADLVGMVGGSIYVEAKSPTGSTWGDMRLNLQVDGIKPTSTLNAVPASVNSTAVQLSWSASDGQSGVSHVEIEYSVDGGVWQRWSVQPPGGSTSAWFLGESGKSYQFRLRAVDRAGNAQDWPTTARGPVRLNAACPSPDPDPFEPGNNTRAGATPMAFQTYLTQRFCSGSDQDWASFQAQAGRQVLLLAASDSGGAAAVLRVYDGSNNLLAEKLPAGLGQSNMLIWTPPASGTYYLQATPLVNALYGGDVRYRLWNGDPRFVFLPTIQR